MGAPENTIEVQQVNSRKQLRRIKHSVSNLKLPVESNVSNLLGKKKLFSIFGRFAKLGIKFVKCFYWSRNTSFGGIIEEEVFKKIRISLLLEVPDKK